MALLDLRVNPSEGELRWFGLLVLAVFGLVGGIVLWRVESLPAAAALWGTGSLFSAVYYAVRGLRLPLFRLWMVAVYPIGWTISHLGLALVFYLGITPIGLVMRLFGFDPLQRRIVENAESYWTRRRRSGSEERYFRRY